MRLIRLLGVVVLFYSMSYLLHALMQVTSSALNPGRTELFKYIPINLVIGAVTFIIGVGLLLLKEWARTAWLVTGIALLLTHAVLLRLFYASGEDLTNQTIEHGDDSFACSDFVDEVNAAVGETALSLNSQRGPNLLLKAVLQDYRIRHDYMSNPESCQSCKLVLASQCLLRFAADKRVIQLWE